MLLMVEDALVNLLFALPSEFLYVLGWSRVLGLRRKPLFWTLWAVLMLASLAMRFGGFTGVRTVMVLLLYFVLPLAFSGGKVWFRVVVVCLCQVGLLLAELLGMALWTTLTNGAALDLLNGYRVDLLSFSIVHLVHTFVLALLMWGMSQACLRLRHERAPGHLAYFALVPLAQVVLMSMLCWITLYDLHAWGSNLYAIAGLALLFLGADVLYLVLMRKSLQARSSKQQAILLQQQVQASLQACQAELAQVEAVCKIRHDLRNQLQVVDALCARGCYHEALRNVEELRESVAGLGITAKAGGGGPSCEMSC